MFVLAFLAAAADESLFENAFARTRSLSRDPEACAPYIAKWNPLDPDLSVVARRALNRGTLVANDKSKGSGWMINLGFRKSIRYDLPFAGGNHESAVSPDGKYLAIPNYEIPSYNSTEGGATPGSSVSIVEVNTGRSAVLPMGPNPWAVTLDGVPVQGGVKPKPHDATYLPNGDLLITGQVADSIVKIDAKTGNVTKFALRETGCSTPHLVRVVPSKVKGEAPRFAVTGCRGSNYSPTSEEGKAYVGRLAVMDLETGQVASYKTPGGKWNEGVTVTAEGEIWIGSLNEHFVTVFGWLEESGEERRVDNLREVKRIPLKYPLRLAYDKVTDRVAVATMNLGGVLSGDPSDSGLHVFDAKTKELVKGWLLRTDRGPVNPEGLRAGPGFFYTGGFDTQAIVVVDAKSLEQVVEIHLPRCTLPVGLCEREKYMPNGRTPVGTVADQAKSLGLTGWNNWSGGYCVATERSPFDRRFTVLDGFNYSPVFPAWAFL